MRGKGHRALRRWENRIRLHQQRDVDVASANGQVRIIALSQGPASRGGLAVPHEFCAEAGNKHDLDYREKQTFLKLVHDAISCIPATRSRRRRSSPHPPNPTSTPTPTTLPARPTFFITFQH